MAALFLLLLLGVLGAKANNTSESLEVTTTVGIIRGSCMTSRLGKDIFAFRGVRYAEPPVGQLRFQQAVPVEPWDDVFDATVDGPVCPQPYLTPISEDCLRLNIYTTQLPSTDTEEAEVKRPVLVYFHAGGFYENSAISSIYGPEYLLDQDIVLVTVNYRLGSLGFLSTGDSLAPGNLGLKDQVEALRWVQKNIASFGGDPGSVTITGYSAGGWSVSLHMVSPMSEGLFHRAIASSGSLTIQFPIPCDQKHLAIKQAEILECPVNTTESMLDCLKTKTAEDFGDSLSQFFEWQYDPILVWSAVIEPEVYGTERFLPAHPEELIRQGKFHQVPLITGVTKDEFGGNVVSFIEAANAGNNSVFEDLDENWETLAPIIFLYERDTNRSKEISQELRQFYFEDQPISNATVDGVAKLYADSVTGFSVHRLAKLISAASEEPVYYYKFTYQGRYSHTTWSDTKKPYGVVHHDDLLYLFNVSLYFPYFEPNDPEIPTVERMTSIWANFAKTGNPIPANNTAFEGVQWEPFTVENNEYLDIGDDLVMKTGLFTERMNVWEELFPLYPSDE